MAIGWEYDKFRVGDFGGAAAGDAAAPGAVDARICRSGNYPADRAPGRAAVFDRLYAVVQAGARYPGLRKIPAVFWVRAGAIRKDTALFYYSGDVPCFRA